MNRLFSYAACALLVSSCTQAPGPKAEGPLLTVGQRTHAFGKVSDAKPLAYTFSFKNEGSSDLVISKIKTSCSCTAAELSKMEFAPGEGDTIVVDWEPKGYGRQAQTVDIFSNSTVDPVLRLEVNADVEPKLRTEPRTADFGTVELRSSQQKVVELLSDDPSLTILSVETPGKHLRVSYEEGGDRPKVGAVRVTVLATAPMGNLLGAVWVEYQFHDQASGETLTKRKSFQVKANVFGALSLDPTAFRVGRVKPGGEVSYPVRIEHHAGSPFTVVSAELVQSSVKTLQVAVRPLAPGKVELLLEGPVEEYLGSIRGTVKVRTDVPGEETFDLRVMGIVRADD